MCSVGRSTGCLTRTKLHTRHIHTAYTHGIHARRIHTANTRHILAAHPCNHSCTGITDHAVIHISACPGPRPPTPLQTGSQAVVDKRQQDNLEMEAGNFMHPMSSLLSRNVPNGVHGAIRCYAVRAGGGVVKREGKQASSARAGGGARGVLCGGGVRQKPGYYRSSRHSQRI